MRVVRKAGLLFIAALVAAAGILVPPAAAEPSAPPPAPTVVALAAASFGSKLVDGQGATLYLFSLDTPGTSKCTGACTREWPPLRSSGGKPEPGAGVSASDLGSIQRPDGSDQVTFDGRPLYYYGGDASPGDSNGHGLSAYGGQWSTVPPAAPSGPPTPVADASVIQNGDFEDGLTSWTAGGIAPPSTANTEAQVHSGSGSAVLGALSDIEPLGDSTLSQTITLPAATSTLRFWYWPSTTDTTCSGASCLYDWQEAQLRDTAGATLASVFKLNSNAQAWTQVTFDTSTYAGQSIVLWFNVHSDGATPADETWMYLDDVSLTTGSPPPAPAAAAAPSG